MGDARCRAARLANAAELIEATTQAEDALTEGDDALARRLARVVQKLPQASADDPALADIVALLEPAAIQLDEAARALRDYRRRLDLDPAELARVEQRLAAIHDIARKHRVRPEALHALAAIDRASASRSLPKRRDAGALAARRRRSRRALRRAGAPRCRRSAPRRRMRSRDA